MSEIDGDSPSSQYWNLLTRYLKPHRAILAGLLLLILASIGFQLVLPLIMRTFIDSAIAEQPTHHLRNLALLFIALVICKHITTIASTYVTQNLSWQATNTLRNDLTLHCMHLPMSFHNQHSPGHMIERIDGDVSALSNFLSQFILRIIANAILLSSVFVLLFVEDWRVGLALLMSSMATFLLLSKTVKIGIPYAQSERQSSAELFGYLEERVSATEDIKANGAVREALHSLNVLMRTLLLKSRKRGMMGSIPWAVTNSMFIVSEALTLIIGLFLFQEQIITIGTIYLILSYNTLLLQPLEQFARQIQDLQSASASAIRVQELLDMQTEEKNLTQPDTSTVWPTYVEQGMKVEFDGVSFGYNSAAANVQNISFSLEPGETLGLIGRTGSGKTTLTRLLFRFYKPDRGVIRIGSGASMIDINAIPLSQLRQNIGLVTQEVELFHASVKNNLTFFSDADDATISDEQLIEHLRTLGLYDWYQSLPHGLESEIGSSEHGLSSGEAQLLALARVFAKNPRLVILDEPSSRLDPTTQDLLKKTIDTLLQGRTAIIIAHRLSTLKKVDKIIIMQNGNIIEQGDREHLARDPDSHFHKLLSHGVEEVLA